MFPKRLDRWLERRGVMPIFFYLAAFFLVAGAWGVVVGVNNVRQADASESWPTTTGRIVRSYVSSGGGGGGTGMGGTAGTGGGGGASATVCYTYAVSGESFRSCKLWHAGRDEPYSTEKTLETYPEGRDVQVFYDPDDPSDAVLITGRHGWEIYLELISGAAMFLVSAPLLVWMLRRRPEET